MFSSKLNRDAKYVLSLGSPLELKQIPLTHSGFSKCTCRHSFTVKTKTKKKKEKSCIRFCVSGNGQLNITGTCN